MTAQQYQYEKQTLMNRLLDAVKQCQIRFGGKTELATELDSRVSCLCSAWESIIQHGLKHANRTLSALKQMTEIAGLSKIGLLEELKNMETEPAFWKYAKQHLSPHELQRYERLRNVTTDAGRGRAWIRASLNEHSLERYIHMLIEDDQLLCAFYEDWAFLRDQDKRHVLPNAAAGLKSVLFAINIDNAELNAIRRARGLDNIMSSATGVLSSSPTTACEPTTEQLRPVMGSRHSGAEIKKEKRKKKKVPKIVSFDDVVNDSVPVSSGSGPYNVPHHTFTSASLPCTPGYNTRFDIFGSVETAGSVSTESTTSSKSDDAATKIAESIASIESSRNINIKHPIGNAEDNNISDETSDTQSVPTFSSYARTVNGVNDKLSSENNIQDGGIIDHAASSKTNPVAASEQTSNSVVNVKGQETDREHGFGMSLLQRVSSKTSLDSVLTTKSSKNDQGVTVVDVGPRSTHVKGHRRGHSDTSMFANIGSRLLKSVISVSKRKTSTDGTTEESSQANSVNTLVDQTNGGLFRTSSFGSFDNVSLKEQSKDSDSIDSASTLPTVGSSHKSNSANHIEVFSQSVQNQNSKQISGAELQEFNKTDYFHIAKEKRVENPTLHHFMSTGMDNNDSLSSLTNFTNSIYSSDYGDDSAMVPLTSDGQLVTGSLFRPDLNTTVSSSPSGSADFGGYHETTQQATLAIALAQQSYMTSETMRTQGDGSHFPDRVTSCTTSQDSMTTAELKEAIIAMMKRKDEVEEENRHIRCAFDGELEVCNTLRAELAETKSAHQAQQDRDSKRMKDLSRENELLKHQLRKYVSAVQMLRRQGAKDEDFPDLHLDDVQPAIPSLQISTDFVQEAADYESKLIQVAEMHGELMEFNEFLHKQLLAKDKLIRDMQQELVDLRGPLPNDVASIGDDWSIISESERSQGSRPLINIWIPAAFLKGKPSSTYHVYQVYIRIRDEEWNVYRRYTEFLDMHYFLKKRNPVVTTFQFPPKKAIGNKDEKFVEHRRKQLQLYLRKVINLIVHINASLSVDINRRKLAQTLSFFGDLTQTREEAQTTQANTRRRSDVPRSPPANELHYSGL